MERLLRAYTLAGDFLEHPVLPLEKPVGEGPGSLIGRYKLPEEIGEGGCGRVKFPKDSLSQRS